MIVNPRFRPVTHEGYQLFHDGAIALARVEHNGIRVDEGYLDSTIKRLAVEITEDRKRLFESDEWKLWRKRFGAEANLDASEQLAAVLYEELGLPVTERTKKGKPSTDEKVLEGMKSPFLQSLLRFKKKGKAYGTYLKNIRRETVDGYLHPFFNLNKVITYRSSSDSPNFQNMPIRDVEIGRMIRRCFIPRKGRVLVENDFKGLEVCVAACYNKDPVLIAYIKNPKKDMHRDMAAQLYILEPGQVSKKTRYGAKNKFVFPQFYGSYFGNCAPDLWEWIDLGKLKIEGTDIGLKEHLAEHGITELGVLPDRVEGEPWGGPPEGTFLAHVQSVERDFWDRRFRVYAKWKKQWFQDYLDKGYFDTYTGFRIEGLLEKNEAVNYPIQGSGFHCLLWTDIQAQRRIDKRGMKSLIVGQIHDSILGDVPVEELEDYNAMIHDLVGNGLPAHWDWINVPMQAETEIVAPHQTWYDKQEVHYKDGQFLLDGTPCLVPELLTKLQQKKAA